MMPRFIYVTGHTELCSTRDGKDLELIVRFLSSIEVKLLSR